MYKVTTSLTVSIAGEQGVSAYSDVIDAQAIGQIDVDLIAGDPEVTVDVQPGAADQIHALLVFSSYYGQHLTYVFSDGATDSTEILTLDTPHIYSAGNLGLVGVTPTQIKFTMAATGEDAVASIYVVRNVHP